MSRGYFGIGVYNPKKEINIGTLWRSAYNFGASFIFTIGKRYRDQSSDTCRSYKHVPLFHYQSFFEFRKLIPYNSIVVAVEQDKSSKDICNFAHPERAIYLLGAEDYGLSVNILKQCHYTISISTPLCLNVSIAGSIVMYDRLIKLRRCN